MQAVTVVPGTAGSARLDEVPEPGAELGSVVVEALAVGVCGTDVEIANGDYGWAPPGEERLILGHESLGRVVDPGPTGLAVGEHVVGIVRRPDPVPCPSCAVGEWDMCSNGGYTERGIKQVDGFMAERWRIEPEYVVRVDKSLGVLGVLLEPTTVVAKAWAQILAIGQRTFWDPHTVLVVGAGPIGLLAALLGVQRGAEVHVLDRVTTGPKPALVEALGAVYHTGPVADLGLNPDIVVECTGVASLIQQAAHAIAPGGIMCLTGVGAPSPTGTGPGSTLATDAVLKNLVLFGSVNANRRHYYRAAKALASADRSWLEQLVTRRVRPDDVEGALARTPDDIKVVMEFARP
jgi:threonine dehydrogenase-like Zn-dependent dehydrogenase